MINKLKLLYGKDVKQVTSNVYEFLDKDGSKKLINEMGNMLNISDGTIEWGTKYLICIRYNEHLMLITTDFSKKEMAINVYKDCGYCLVLKENKHGVYIIELINGNAEKICSSMTENKPESIKIKDIRPGVIVYEANIWRNGNKYIGRKQIVCNIKTGEIRIENG